MSLQGEVAEVFQPAGLLPEQIVASRVTTPELRLLLEVLREGIKDSYFDIEDGRAWVKSKRKDYLFSFVSLCEILGFDPEAAREALRSRWKITQIGNKYPITQRQGAATPGAATGTNRYGNRSGGNAWRADISSGDTDPPGTE